jgi:NhaA family Na+:H+ antiporter
MTEPIETAEPSSETSHRRRRRARRRLVRRLARRALAPVEGFLAVEAASGILLLLATAAALVWANSALAESYVALWHAPVGATLLGVTFERELHFWINDGVMTLFFFVVGLEIRREVHDGELSDRTRAALPAVAALGGMLVPAGIYFALNRGLPSVSGWGVPMATDIAFAVGVLTLLGSRVPAALRVLLLAIAVIDDIGAILVIAIFYSSDLSPSGFLIAGVGLGLIRVLREFGASNPWIYVPPAAIAWAGALAAGVHPTLAGVIVGLMTPVVDDDDEAAESPAERIQHALHGWVAYGAMPLFALANAGVALDVGALAGDAQPVLWGVILGLVVGKPIGIVGIAWLATRIGVTALPGDVRWSQVAVVGVVAGIGFTMSMFIAQLAFGSAGQLETAKLGVLIASGVCAILAFAFGRAVLHPAPPRVGAQEANGRALDDSTRLEVKAPR